MKLILGALITGVLVTSAVAQDHHLQPPTSGNVTVAAPAKTSNMADMLATDPPVPLTPRNLLEEYEKQMAVASLKTCEELAHVAQPAREGQIGPEQAQCVNGQRLELGMIRLQFLDLMHQILDAKIQEETKSGPEVQSSGDTLVVSPPDSSPDLSQAIVRYLKLTPVQIAAIQSKIDEERDRVRPLVKRLTRNRQALTAATVKGRFDVGQMRDLAAELLRIQEQVIVANARLQVAAYKILTVEQQRKLDGMRKETAGLIPTQIGGH
jgi:Spy/CpxP family protein refolding chaperone